MTDKSLQQLLDEKGDIVEFLRNQQVGPNAYPGVPGEYSNWRDEQRSWAESSVLFNQSFHMVDLLVTGPGAFDMLAYLAPNSFKGFVPNRSIGFDVLESEEEPVDPEEAKSYPPYIGRPWEALDLAVGEHLGVAAGERVGQRADGEAGLSMARQVPYDAAVVDIMLPKLDGLTASFHLLEPGGTAMDVIVVTGSASAAANVTIPRIPIQATTRILPQGGSGSRCRGATGRRWCCWRWSGSRSSRPAGGWRWRGARPASARS